MANNIGYTFGSKPDYTVGSTVLTAGSKNFTVTGGANLQTANILPGYTLLHPNGKILVIANITNATSGALLDNCPSDCGGTIRTLIRYQSEGSSLSAAVRDLLSGINSGLLSSISALPMTEGKIIVGDVTAKTAKLVTLNTDNVPVTATKQYVTSAEKGKIANALHIERNFHGKTANDVLDDAIYYGGSQVWTNVANNFPETAYGTLEVFNLLATNHQVYPRTIQRYTTENGNIWTRFLTKTATGINYGTWINLNKLNTNNKWTGANVFEANAGNLLNPIQITAPKGEKIFHRADGNNYYILLGGASDTSFNNLRPVSINLTSGAVVMRNGLTATGGFTSDNVAVTGNLTASGRNLTNRDIGLVGYFPFLKAPYGWIEADGRLINRANAPLLWAAVEEYGGAVSEQDWNNNRGAFSVGNGSTNFRLPDYRGEFIRGLDNGRGADSGRKLGSMQGDAIRNIHGWAHGFDGGGWLDPNANLFGGVLRAGNNSSSNVWSTLYAQVDTNTRQPGKTVLEVNAALTVPTASENRPRNIALLACVRYL